MDWSSRSPYNARGLFSKCNSDNRRQGRRSVLWQRQFCFWWALSEVFLSQSVYAVLKPFSTKYGSVSRNRIGLQKRIQIFHYKYQYKRHSDGKTLPLHHCVSFSISVCYQENLTCKETYFCSFIKIFVVQKKKYRKCVVVVNQVFTRMIQEPQLH